MNLGRGLRALFHRATINKHKPRRAPSVCAQSEQALPPLQIGLRVSRDIYWIDAPPPGRLAILSRPRAGEWLADQLAGWRAGGIDAV
jgi:hypothetical protein